MTFDQIVAESEKTRHEVYHYLAPNGKLYSAPAPVAETVADGATEMQRLRNTERQERAAKLAELVHAGTIEKCEELGVDIAALIDPPEHITIADGDLPVELCLILEN